MNRLLTAVTFARQKNVPFLGTCGGYQHAALEFARNALALPCADNAEVNPDAEMPLISGLVCKLVEVSDEIILQADSQIRKIYGRETVSEEYRCGYGVNPKYLPLFEGNEMTFTGFDADNDPRVLKIPSHRFFIGTAFQLERSALKNQSHPIVESFLDAIAIAPKKRINGRVNTWII